MSASTPAGPGAGPTTSNPAISGTGTGMGSGNATGHAVTGGVQRGTINDAAQGAPSGEAADPSLGSGMGVTKRADRMGAAATGGAPGMERAPLGASATLAGPLDLPYRIIGPGSRAR